jgi:type IV pilus assembly protein PilP
MKRARWLGLALAIGACSDEAPPPPVPAVKAKATTDGKPAEAPQAPAGEDFTYSPVGKRDPFRPFFIDELGEEKGKKEEKLTELQKYEIDQLKLVAILSGTSQPEAMFEDPRGMGWTVSVGTPIGKNGGRVQKIKKDEVVILEEFRDATGKKITNPLIVKLPGEELVLDKP